MVNIREFSEEAEFKNPCSSYVLADVICTFCSQVRDIDLLRDTDVMMQQKWECPNPDCKHSYDKDAVEERLVEVVRKRSLSYQIQDLKCTKCRMVKADNLSDVCTTCSGKFVCRTPETDFKADLRIFYLIAKCHSFHWLEEETCCMLGLPPSFH
jgi:DNA polymerase epsilon subunit 1